MPRISVLIPAYNEEGYLGACLESLRSLNYPDLEIIVANNNSTDRTCEIAAEFPGVIIVNETKKGPNAARQKALIASTGSTIASLDADCVVSPNWIKNALPHFDRQETVAVSGMCLFDGGSWYTHLLEIETRYVLKFFHFVVHHVMHKYGIMLGGNAWYRREALEKIGGFDAGIEFWGDDAHTAEMLTKIGRIDYDTRVVVMTSSRRFERTGPFLTMYRYLVNYLSMWGRKKSASSSAEHYR